VRVTTLTSRKLAIAATAVATVAAGLPVLLSTGASAAATGDISLTGPTRGAAGTCLTYTVTPTDPFGKPATDTGTVVIRLTENPNDAGQDVDFCNPGSLTAPTANNRPHYLNPSNTRQLYTAGPTITSTATTGTPPSNPDVAAKTGSNQANPAGTDTAVYVYDGRQGASTTITFGVVGLVPGAATIDAFRSADGDEVQSPGDFTRSMSVTFSAGGLPGSPEAADAVTTVAITPKTSYSPTGGAAHAFTVKLTNSSGDGVSGVTPSIGATAGVNAGTSTTAATYTASCTQSDNTGTSTCSYRGTKSGSDTVTVWVDQTRARTTPANPTAGIDNNEPRDTATAWNTVATAQAKLIDLTPATASVTSGTSKTLTATVTDASGTPAAGVPITFSETGPGTIQGGTTGNGGTSSLNATTDASGAANVTITTASTDSGTSTVTADIRTPNNTACQTNGGRCSDSSTLTIAVAPSPTPTPTPTRTATPTPTGPTCATASTLLGSALINAMETANVTVTATAGSVVDLFAYTRPSVAYTVVRSGPVGSDGTVTWGIRPPRNTRLYAQQRGCPAGNQVVLGVRTTLTLGAVRNGPRTYSFYGDSLPARPGGLIVSLYRITASGSQVLTAQVRASAATGEWSLTRRFSGSGVFDFVLRTGQDLQNAPGASHVRRTSIF
jgi:hypothetical protein